MTTMALLVAMRVMSAAEEILEEVDSARNMGISNTIVSVGGDGDDTFLETLADKGDGNYVFIEDDESATDLFEKLYTINGDTPVSIKKQAKEVLKNNRLSLWKLLKDGIRGYRSL